MSKTSPRSPIQSFDVEAKQKLKENHVHTDTFQTDEGTFHLSFVRGPSGLAEEPPCSPWALLPILGALIIFSVPAMTFGLYKSALQDVLGLTAAQVGDIASCGLFGGTILGFLPGLVYDKFGYVITLTVGGILSSAGAFLWYSALKDGGQQGSPGWLELGLPLALLCHGCRGQYLTGMCAVLGIFPKELVGTISAIMAVVVSVGYIVLPLLWKTWFLPVDAESYAPDGKTLMTLTPVANFFLFLSIAYMIVTVIALSLAPFIPKKQLAAASSQLTMFQRLAMINAPAPLVLTMLVVTALSPVNTFMVSGLGSVAALGNLGAAEQAAVISRMGLFGMAGRLMHGFGSDILRSKTPARQAGNYIAYISAVFGGLCGFLIIAMASGSVDPDERQTQIYNNLPYAAYLIGFSFGGIFALLPASIRTLFGADLMGFWLGSLFALYGCLFFLWSRVGAMLGWGESYFRLCTFMASLAIAGLLYLTVSTWGQE